MNKLSKLLSKYGDFAKKNKIDIAFVSPDDILNTDLVDKLSENHIPVASPGQKAAN